MLPVPPIKTADKINIASEEEERAKNMMQLRNLIVLADNFNINTEEEKKRFFGHIKQIDPTSSLNCFK